MASKKKTTKKPAEPKQILDDSVPAKAEEVHRNKVLICDKPFYVDANIAASMVPFEAATRGMDRATFEDFVQRYRLKIELWADATSNVKVVLADSEKVLGDWI